MRVNYAKLIEEGKRLAAIQYIRLLGQKNPENVIQEDNGFYSHTNTRGKKRMLLPCVTFAEYKGMKEKYTETKMKKCLGCYVMEIIV